MTTISPSDMQSILPLSLKNICYKAATPPQNKFIHPIGKSKNKKLLLKDISCDFQAGHKYMILGPNGAGKSILLKLCHGLLKPESGEIRWHNITKEKAALAQAMVAQRPVMLRRSAYDNIDYALKVKGVAKTERRQIVEDVLEKTGLTRLADRSARVLSLGEQQRLAIARAWTLRPQVIFLDEPTASLDPPATFAVEELINEIANEGTTVIMSSHDLNQAQRLGSHALFLFRGRIKEFAPKDEFFNNPQNDLLQAFLDGKLMWWKNRTEENPDGDDVQFVDTDENSNFGESNE